MVVTGPLIDGVDGEGDEPRVGTARVPFWAGAQADPNQTAVPASPRLQLLCGDRLKREGGTRLNLQKVPSTIL